MANFTSVPTINAPRSRFDLSYSVKTTGNVGDLIPMYLQEIYPGDVFNLDTTTVTRLSSAYLRPVMDDLYLDQYYFFIPSRLVFNQWEEIFGENKVSAWAQVTPVAAPTWDYISGLDQDVVAGSVADHLGLPLTDVASGKCLPDGLSMLPFRCLAIVYDTWFRDQNLVAPMQIYKGPRVAAAEYINNSPWSALNYMGMLPKVAKFHDYFTSCLPGTQKGDAVTLPINGSAPLKVGTSTYTIDPFNGAAVFGPTGSTSGRYLSSNASNVLSSLPNSSTFTVPASWDTNLVADLNAAGVQATVNDLRYAFQLQKILERSARSGTRYYEYLLSAFSVQSPDARLQRPEYLGGKRMPLSVQQVAQTTRASSGPETLASLGAFSLSNGKTGYTKGFVEHGFVLGVMCVRQRHTYQQGIEKFWSRHNRFDFYDPIFANIGEQPVFRSEVFALGAAGTDYKAVPFGYQEAWADLRYRPNQVSGSMRSDSPTSLDIWSFVDDYANAPTLNQGFIEETPDFVDRTIAVPSSSMDQFIFDIYHHNIGTRRLPMYSVPSLIDHH